MIHYHGLPITPAAAATHAIRAGHAFVSFRYPEQVGLAIECGQSFALDNGAYSHWRAAGAPKTDWSDYYAWVAGLRRIPSCDWAVIPDIIGGTEADNDALIAEWPHGLFGVPVWHLHETIDRLVSLVEAWPRVALGSSGDYSAVGTDRWWRRIMEVMVTVCDKDGYPRTKLHGLRMLSTQVFGQLPLASADSCNIGRNIGIDSHWTGAYPPPDKGSRAALLRARIEAVNAPERWVELAVQRQGKLL